MRSTNQPKNSVKAFAYLSSISLIGLILSEASSAASCATAYVLDTVAISAVVKIAGAYHDPKREVL